MNATWKKTHFDLPKPELKILVSDGNVIKFAKYQGPYVSRPWYFYDGQSEIEPIYWTKLPKIPARTFIYAYKAKVRKREAALLARKKTAEEHYIDSQRAAGDTGWDNIGECGEGASEGNQEVADNRDSERISPV